MTAAKKAAPSAPKKSSASKKAVPAGQEGRAEVAPPEAAAKKAPAAKKAAAKKAPGRQEGGHGGQEATRLPDQDQTARRRPRRPPRPRRPRPGPRSGPRVGPYAKEPKFLDEQRALLLEERGIYKGQAVDLRAEADSLALEREPGDVQFDEESGEGGTVTVDRERNLALSAQASAAVEEIDDALRKIDRKSYGGCERCYQPIPKARLRALPFARLCVACKSGGLSRR